MPVQKFRTFEEAEEALWLDRSDPDLRRRINSHWRRVSAFLTPAIPRGVARFRTIQEANAAREACEDARVTTAARARTSD